MPSSGSERQRKAGPCARRCARVPSVEPPSMTRNSYSPFSCERTEATVAAIFAPQLKVGVITDISGWFMTNRSLRSFHVQRWLQRILTVGRFIEVVAIPTGDARCAIISSGDGPEPWVREESPKRDTVPKPQVLLMCKLHTRLRRKPLTQPTTKRASNFAHDRPEPFRHFST